MKASSLALLLGLTPLASSAANEVADPLNTRGTLMTSGRYDAWSTEVPLPGQPRLLEGKDPSVFLSTDLYGKYLGFSLSFRVLSTDKLMADGQELNNSRFILVEAEPDFNYVLYNKNSLFLSAGAGAHVRFNVLNMNEAFSKSVSSWYMVTGGVNARTRYFVSENIYATASVFVGPVAVGGRWVAAGTSSNPNGPPSIPPSASLQPFFLTGELQNPLVINGLASLSFRPTEWFALHAGVAYRSATFDVMEGDQERGTATEVDVQPFAGVDFLY